MRGAMLRPVSCVTSRVSSNACVCGNPGPIHRAARSRSCAWRSLIRDRRWATTSLAHNATPATALPHGRTGRRAGPAGGKRIGSAGRSGSPCACPAAAHFASPDPRAAVEGRNAGTTRRRRDCSGTAPRSRRCQADADASCARDAQCQPVSITAISTAGTTVRFRLIQPLPASSAPEVNAVHATVPNTMKSLVA